MSVTRRGFAKGYALIAVIGQRTQNKGALLADGQQALLLRCHGHACTRVGVDHALHIGPGFMHGAVNDEACGVHGKRRLHELVAGHVHLDQRRGGDLVKHQPVGVDEKVVICPRQACADVGEDQIAPAVEGHQPVAGRKIGAQLPLFGADQMLHAGDVQGRGSHGLSPSSLMR